MERVCKSCFVKKPVSEFYKKRDSFESSCKKCKYKNAKRYSLNCEVCNNEFTSTKKHQKFCSISCRSTSREKLVIRKCGYCKETFKRTPSTSNVVTAYCSIECRNKHLSYRVKGENNPNWKGKTSIIECECCGKPFEYKDYFNSENKYCSQKCKSIHQMVILKGKNNPNFKNRTGYIKCDCCNKDIERPMHNIELRKNNYCSLKCKYKHTGLLYSGPNNPNYTNGLSHNYRARYRIVEGYGEWKKSVMERDSFTCQLCGCSKGGNLHAHHLDGYNWAEEKRTDVDNGITLCSSCHINFHKTYGNGNNTKKQFEEYKNNFKTLA